MSQKSAGRKKRSTHTRTSATPDHAIRPALLLRGRKIVRELLPVIAIVLVTRTMLGEAFRIPSGSMEPTLLVGDWLFVNKLRFGPHIPFTQRSLPGYATPIRGDVVVFESPPQDPAIRITPDDITPTLVKRIVGLPGDTLLMRGGKLTVNGIVDSRSTSQVAIADQPQPLFAWQHRIELNGSRFGSPVAQPSLHEWGPLVVPDGAYFMMGDNRDNSVDSRYYGPVPRRNLRGTPMFVYYSYDPEAGLDYFRAITDIRWRRLGTWIR
jgi:signal peptidase I